MIQTIIIDDERHSCDALKMLLDKCCPQIEVKAICNSAKDGLQKINELKPDLIFLDIEMPHMNGFQMLEQLSKIDFEIIFFISRLMFTFDNTSPVPSTCGPRTGR